MKTEIYLISSFFTNIYYYLVFFSIHSSVPVQLLTHNNCPSKILLAHSLFITISARTTLEIPIF